MGTTFGPVVALALICLQMQGAPRDSINTKALVEKCADAISHFSEFKHTRVGRIKVLAWYRDRLKSGWFLDCALCWAELDTEYGKRWAVAHMSRTPRKRGAKNPFQEWRIYFVHEANNDWLYYYEMPPKNSEIYAHFRYFKWVPVIGTTRYSSYLDHNEWVAIFGEAPTKSP